MKDHAGGDPHEEENVEEGILDEPSGLDEVDHVGRDIESSPPGGDDGSRPVPVPVESLGVDAAAEHAEKDHVHDGGLPPRTEALTTDAQEEADGDHGEKDTHPRAPLEELPLHLIPVPALC